MGNSSLKTKGQLARQCSAFGILKVIHDSPKCRWVETVSHQRRDAERKNCCRSLAPKLSSGGRGPRRANHLFSGSCVQKLRNERAIADTTLQTPDAIACSLARVVHGLPQVRARNGWHWWERCTGGAVESTITARIGVAKVGLAAARIDSPNRKSPEGKPQKCAAGRDAVQIAERKEVVSKRGIPSHPFPQYKCDGLGAVGERTSPCL